MTLNDSLANMYSTILNHEKIGKRDVLVKVSSKMAKKNLDILKREGYIEEYKEKVVTTTPQLNITLSGTINKCGAIKPRFSVKLEEYEKFEKRFLPAKNFGIIIVSTSKGLMTHKEAKEEKLGGRLIAYCY